MLISVNYVLQVLVREPSNWLSLILPTSSLRQQGHCLGCSTPLYNFVSRVALNVLEVLSRNIQFLVSAQLICVQLISK